MIIAGFMAYMLPNGASHPNARTAYLGNVASMCRNICLRLSVKTAMARNCQKRRFLSTPLAFSTASRRHVTAPPPSPVSRAPPPPRWGRSLNLHDTHKAPRDVATVLRTTTRTGDARGEDSSLEIPRGRPSLRASMANPESSAATFIMA